MRLLIALIGWAVLLAAVALLMYWFFTVEGGWLREMRLVDACNLLPL
jgi:hypothetical protein